MGIICSAIDFNQPIPKAELIVETMTRISGLPVSIISSKQDDLYELSTEVAFMLFPETYLKIFAYHRVDESQNKRTLYVTCCMQEETLYYVAIQALELLGGLSKRKLSDTFKLILPITSLELEKRHNEYRHSVNKLGLKILFVSPILIPYVILNCLYEVLSAKRKLKKQYPDIFR